MSLIDNSSLTEAQRQYNGRKIVFSTNSARTTEYLHAGKKKNINLDWILYPSQKLAQNGSQY